MPTRGQSNKAATTKLVEAFIVIASDNLPPAAFEGVCFTVA
jgi:hypothetical protein